MDNNNTNSFKTLMELRSWTKKSVINVLYLYNL